MHEVGDHVEGVREEEQPHQAAEAEDVQRSTSPATGVDERGERVRNRGEEGIPGQEVVRTVVRVGVPSDQEGQPGVQENGRNLAYEIERARVPTPQRIALSLRR
jgi:hypothetical protein